MSIQTHQHLYIPGKGHPLQRRTDGLHLLSESGRIVSKCRPKMTALQPVIELSRLFGDEIKKTAVWLFDGVM